MTVSFKQISAFLTVAETGSFTRAAERLDTAQPALSQLVRDLETTLGLRLFDRTTRRVELTEAGREFRVMTAKIVDDLDFAVRATRDVAQRRRGRVLVAAPPLLAATVLSQAAAVFATRHPQISLVVVDAPTPEVLDLVRTGGVDLGIGTFAGEQSGVERETLARDRLLLYCPPDHAWARRSRLAWSDLEGHALVTLTRESAIRLLVELGYESAQMQLSPIYEVRQISTALALVAAGQGITVLPSYARAEARFRGLRCVPLVEPDMRRDIVMLRAAGRSLSPAAQSLAPILRAAVRRTAPRA
jgi:DNA-binding transcriptional LysR family regulator